MAADYISPDKVVGSFFNRTSRNADISGNVPSDHLVKEDGRMGRRTADKVKIHDDIQHKGWCFTGNGASSLIEKDIVGISSSSTLSISSISIGLFHFLVYIPDTLTDQGNQKLFGRGNDIGIQIRTSSSGLSIRVRGNYRPYWLYEFEDGSYKLNDWNWISVYRDGSNTTDTTLSSANEAVKVWINGTQLNNLTTANPGTQSAGNSAVEWRLFDWSHVDSGFNPANYVSLFTFFGMVYPFDQGPDLSVVTDIHNSSFSLKNIETLYVPNADIGCYCGGGAQNTICFGRLVESPNDGDVYVNNDLPGFIDDTILTPYSIVNEQGYNVAGPSYFKHAYVADNHAQRTPAWASFMADADFSIAFKVNISTLLDGNVYDIVSNSGGTSSGVYLLITGGKIQITVTKSISNTRTVISRDLRDGLDHDILVVHEVNSLQCRIYVDGLEEPYGEQVTGVGGNLYNPNTSWVIGKYAASAGDRNFKGYIRAVAFYNSALTPATLKTANPVAQPQISSDGTVTDLAGGSTWTSNNLDNTDLVPADSTGLYDTLGHRLLDYPGRLAPRIQMVNAPAIKLNATDQALIIPTPILLQGIGKSFTVSLRVCLDQISRSNYFVSGGSNACLRKLSGTPDNTLQLSGNTGVTTFTFANDLPVQKWFTLVLVADIDTSSYNVFVDGVSSIEGYQVRTNNVEFNHIGTNANAFQQSIEGLFCDFRAFSRILSNEEITELNNGVSELRGDLTDLPMSEGNGSAIFDVSGNNNHGEIINPVLPDVWGKQDVFHYNFYKGFIKSLKNMDGVEAFFDFTDIDAYTFDESGQITSVRDTANDYQLINTHADTRFENGALTLKGNRLSIEGSHFLSTLNTFDIFIRGEFKLPYSSQTDFLVVSNNTNAETWTIGKHPIPTIPNVYYDAASATTAYSGNIEVTHVILDQELGYNIKYDGTNLYTGRDTNSLTDHGATSKPADNPLLTRIDFGIDGSQKYLIVFNRNVTDQERLFVNAFMESGLAPAGAVNGVVDQRGYEETNQFNGASDIQFPEIPEIPVDLRGKELTHKEIEGLVYAGRVLNSNRDVALFRDKVKSIHFQRKGSGLILDDYPATCPSTALQKIHSDFTGNILTVRNEDNLQDASFGFDQYGRLPEADIVDHLNGTANGRVTSYYFQDINHSGLAYTQSVLAEMPFIAKSGAIQKDSRGLPALRFDGAQSLAYESQTAFKPMHDGSRGVQVIGFQVDESQDDFWVVGNTDFQGQVGFEFFGDAFNQDKAHFIVRTNTSSSAIQDLNIPILMGEYNRIVNYIDPSNPVAIERHRALINELERAANTYTELPHTGNTEDGTTSVGAFGVREMQGYINELIFIGDHKADMLKLSRSLMFMP